MYVLKGGGHGYFHMAFLLPMFSVSDDETRNSILKILECIEVIKYAIKILLECVL